MSDDARDSSSRLSDALDEIFSRARRTGGGTSGVDEPDTMPSPEGGSESDDSYELPEIVPATADPAPVEAVSEAPRLPDRAGVAEPAVAELRSNAPSASAEAPAVRAADPSRTASPPSSPADTAPRGTAAATRPATGWADHMPTQAAPGAQLRAPGRRPRVRRVTRVVRHVDPWSTFKVALLFNAVAYIVCLTSGVLLWRVADTTGTLDNVERWFTQFGWETFEFDGSEIFHNAWIIGLFGVVAATGAAVLLVTLFNLVSDIVGGVRMTVLEEEVVERTISSTRRYVVRRPTDVGASGRPTTDWSADDLDDEPDAETHPDAATAGDAATDGDAATHAGTAPGNGEDPRAAPAPTRPTPVTTGETTSNDWSVD